MRERPRRPGSQGEHVVQDRCGTWERAQAFYDHQWLDYLNPQMWAFIGRQEMVFIATADSQGDCDASFRAGLPGFVHILDEKTLTYPEYRGNGVKASLGNITENPHIGLLFIDFFEAKIGLHVNGRAQILSSEELLQRPALSEGLRADITIEGGRRPEQWVLVTVEEAYIHCSKHIPLLHKREQEVEWGTDSVRVKGGDYFKAKDSPRGGTQ
jgi:predicted pyridoxine 5'-phosphate oxidase superfamily flavin-nucleotide-binding protein